MVKEVQWSDHAKLKLDILNQRGLSISINSVNQMIITMYLGRRTRYEKNTL